MGRFTNMYVKSENRVDARRRRAAERFQDYNGPKIRSWNSDTQLEVERKMREFCALCRKGTISEDNAYGAIVNVLAPYAEAMGSQNHQHWLAEFLSASKIERGVWKP